MLITEIKKYFYLFRLNKLKKYFRNNISKTNPIIISGSPRGGTTWLYEVFQSTSNRFGLWEPLHDKMLNQFFKKDTYLFHKYIPINSKNKEIETYFNNLLSGKYITTPLLQKNTNFKTYKKTDGLLIKFCRLSPMLPWFNRLYPDIKILQLYRNPLAVVSSQMKHGQWSSFDKNSYKYFINEKNYSKEYYAQFKSVYETIEHPEEVLALIWALDMIPTLNFESENVLKMKYEDLFLDPKINFQKIYRHFSLKSPKDLDSIIKKPSSTTKKGSNILTKPTDQLETWKKHLSEDQVDRIKAILSKLGFKKIGDIDYSLELEREINL